MDRQLAFSTFLKLLELPDTQKAATLRGFRRGGGFNYWRPMQNLAPEVATRRLDIMGIQDRVAVLAKGHQRKYNESALMTLLKWCSRKKLSLQSSPGKHIVPIGAAGLSVRLEPELAFLTGGRNYVMQIWATNNPSLSDETLSAGLFLFVQAFRGILTRDTQYVIFDCVKNRLFTEINMIDNAADMLAAQITVLDALWRDLDRRSTEERKPWPDTGDELDDPRDGPRP